MHNYSSILSASSTTLANFCVACITSDVRLATCVTNFIPNLGQASSRFFIKLTEFASLGL